MTRQIAIPGADPIAVPVDTDPATIAALIATPPLRFWEFVYEGNSPNGENRGAYAELEAWLTAAGLTLRDDDVAMILYTIERQTGFATLTHRGKTLHFHVQARNGSSQGQFGYTWRVEYRLLRVERA